MAPLATTAAQASSTVVHGSSSARRKLNQVEPQLIGKTSKEAEAGQTGQGMPLRRLCIGRHAVCQLQIEMGLTKS